MKQEIDCELTEKKHTFTMLPRDGTITIFPKKNNFAMSFAMMLRGLLISALLDLFPLTTSY